MEYILLLIFYLLFDMVFLNLVLKKIFGKLIQKIQKEKMKVKLIPALAVFPIAAFGLYYFVYDKIRDDHIYFDALRYAFVFGVVTYAIYDLTNMATFKNWSLPISLLDILWGGTVFFLTTITVKNIMLSIKKKTEN